jgi:hypothetical protein
MKGRSSFFNSVDMVKENGCKVILTEFVRLQKPSCQLLRGN